MFSVIIPVHNKLPHLDRSVHSVLNQTFEDFELLLIDDASTDGSSEKLKTYTDSRIRILKRDIPGPGGYAARNLGIKEAKYEWIAFLDADDEWDESYLQEISKAIQVHPQAEFFTADWKIKKEGKVIDKKMKLEGIYTSFSLADYLLDTRFVWTGVLTVKKALVTRDDNIGFPDQDMACKRGGDIDTWIRWLYKSNGNIHINKTLAAYYMDVEGQVTATPNTHFCAYLTLNRILKETTDHFLKKMIKRFNNRFIYNMLARQIRSGMPLDYTQIKKMHFDTYSLLRVLKLHWLKLIG